MTVLNILSLADEIDVINNELRMDSGRALLYVAPVKMPKLTQDFHEINNHHSIISRKNKRSVKYIEGKSKI